MEENLRRVRNGEDMGGNRMTNDRSKFFKRFLVKRQEFLLCKEKLRAASRIVAHPYCSGLFGQLIAHTSQDHKSGMLRQLRRDHID